LALALWSSQRNLASTLRALKPSALTEPTSVSFVGFSQSEKAKGLGAPLRSVERDIEEPLSNNQSSEIISRNERSRGFPVIQTIALIGKAKERTMPSPPRILLHLGQLEEFTNLHRLRKNRNDHFAWKCRRRILSIRHICSQRQEPVVRGRRRSRSVVGAVGTSKLGRRGRRSAFRAKKDV